MVSPSSQGWIARTDALCMFLEVGSGSYPKLVRCRPLHAMLAWTAVCCWARGTLSRMLVDGSLMTFVASAALLLVVTRKLPCCLVQAQVYKSMQCAQQEFLQKPSFRLLQRQPLVALDAENKNCSIKLFVACCS